MTNRRPSLLGKMKQQDGSLLLLAVVVLAVIVLSTVYLSLVLLQEIKSTRFADNGIVSHYVAESGSERALWRLNVAKAGSDSDLFTLPLAPGGTPKIDQCGAENGLEFINNPDPPVPCAGTCLNDSSIACLNDSHCGGNPCNAGDRERLYDYMTVSTAAPEFSVYDLPRNSPVYTDVFDPASEGPAQAFSGGITEINTDWYVEECTPTAASSKLEITYTGIDNNTLALDTPITVIDVCGCRDDTPGLNGWYKCDPTHTSGYSYQVTGLAANKFYRISYRSLDMPVKFLQMTADANIESQIQIDTVGTYRESQTRVTVRAQWKDILSGIFNFVVFSEESLIKDTTGGISVAYASVCAFCSDTAQSACSTNSDCNFTCNSGTCSNGQQPAGGPCTLDSECEGEWTCANPNSAAFCTDGAPEALGNQTDAGQCNAFCNGFTYCGDGTQQLPNGDGSGANGGNEQCDFGGLNSNILPDMCRTDCTTPICGDGVIDPSGPDGDISTTGDNEECDHGGTPDASCTALCKLGVTLINFQPLPPGALAPPPDDTPGNLNPTPPVPYIPIDQTGFSSVNEYGWLNNNNVLSRTRAAGASDLERTFVFVETPEVRMWEIEYAPGDYDIKVMSGDSSVFGQGPHRVLCEEAPIIDDFFTLPGEFVENTERIPVRDGRITMKVGGTAGHSLMNTLEITRALSQPAVLIPVNFQHDTSATPAGFLADVGAPYSAGVGYGWDDDYTTADRERANNFPQVLDTFVWNDDASGTTVYTWDYDVPLVGDYQVWVSVGDANLVQDGQKVVVENVTLINDEVTLAGEFIERSTFVNVTDGQLTVEIGGGTNKPAYNRGGYTTINYIVIEKL